jgi:ectoine hydroxylase-related dioxygenase (phytanoyl-CoA dioxygenase family)
MRFTPLTPEDRAAMDRDGFLVVRGALGPEDVDRIRDAADRVAADFLAKPIVRDRPEYNHIDRRQGLLHDPDLLSLVDHPTTVPLLVQLLGPNIHLHSTALVYKRPEDLGSVPFRRGWHRDIRVPDDLGHVGLPRVGIKVCYCLTDFHQPDSGITKLIRGSHLREQPLELHGDEVDPRGMEVLDLALDAGDAFFFENRIFHTAAPNLSSRTSKVLIYGYSYRWMKQEVYLDPPDPQQLMAADPTRRQLLGGYRDIDTRPWALREWAARHGVMPEPVQWTVSVNAQ